MHIHQQNHWNDILSYWYQSYHWYQWTIGLTNRIRLSILVMCVYMQHCAVARFVVKQLLVYDCTDLLCS